MKQGEIVSVYLAYIDGESGKRRPVLVVEDTKTVVKVFAITSQYKNKSKKIKAQYFPIQDWEISGLLKPSWIDVGILREINKVNTKVRFKSIGELTLADIEKLIDFINNRME